MEVGEAGDEDEVKDAGGGVGDEDEVEDAGGKVGDEVKEEDAGGLMQRGGEGNLLQLR